MNKNDERRAQDIARQNDDLRQTLQFGEVVITQGVMLLAPPLFVKVLAAVIGFYDFTPDNDPYEEHDGAVLTVDGVKIIWKIDYYDKAKEFASPDPVNPHVTIRVLTIMLAEEY